MECELSGVFIWGREPGMEGIRDQELENVLVQKKGFSWASDKRRKYPRKQEKNGAKRSMKRLETFALDFPLHGLTSAQGGTQLHPSLLV